MVILIFIGILAFMFGCAWLYHKYQDKPWMIVITFIAIMVYGLFMGYAQHKATEDLIDSIGDVIEETK